MCKKLSWLLILPSIFIPLLLSCTGSTSPFGASNATISIVLVNSNDQRSTDSVSDTVGKVILVGVKAYLPKYINSVTITITKNAADTDTVVTFRNPSSWTDTQWISVTLHSAGTWTVSAVAVIQGEPNYSVTAKITIIGKPSTVTYDGNGSTGGTVPTDVNTYQQGAGVTVKANTDNLAKSGFTFAGWNTAADGSGTSCAAAATFAMGAANVTLYAKWTQNPTYTVTYNGNGSTSGSAPTDPNAYLQGATVTVIGNTGNLAKIGFTFTGWNTAADGSGTTYAAAATFTMSTANVTLYAKWTQNAGCTVTYDGNENTTGTVPTDPNTYGPNSSVTVKANTGNLAKTGFTFAGWNTAADGSGTSYAAAATFTIGTANVTLYAKWTVSICTVKFNSNGGSAVDSQNVTYNNTATAPTPPTQNGFVFAGWYSDQALTIQFNFLTPITSSITLYAKWTPVYTVTYNGNNNTSGAAPADTNKYTNGATVTVLDNTGSLARTGYTFAGWNTNAAGTGTDRTPGGTFAVGSSNVVLYAKWTPNTYLVAFDGQGATVSANPPTMNVISPADSVGSLPQPPTKTSYVFAGWYTAVNGGGTQFTATTVVNANITVYAKWIIQDADGNIYTEVTVGTQVWMVENLKTTKFNDETGIPLVTDNTAWGNLSTPGYCWYDDSISYKNPYGALYNWYTVNTGKLAPSGWHVASNDEWGTLFANLGGGDSAAGSLKEAGLTHWNSPNTGATNSSGFTGLPGGICFSVGGFASLGDWGMWWTSTEYSSMTTDAWYFALGSTTPFDHYHIGKGQGNSVRCIRNY